MIPFHHLAPALLAAFGTFACGAARAEDAPARALRFTVNPARFARETPEEMLARRTRDSEFLFRFICRGCVKGEGSGGGEAPFNPQATLDGAAPPSREVERVEEVARETGAGPAASDAPQSGFVAPSP